MPGPCVCSMDWRRPFVGEGPGRYRSALQPGSAEGTGWDAGQGIAGDEEDWLGRWVAAACVVRQGSPTDSEPAHHERFGGCDVGCSEDGWVTDPPLRKTGRGGSTRVAADGGPAHHEWKGRISRGVGCWGFVGCGGPGRRRSFPGFGGSGRRRRRGCGR